MTDPHLNLFYSYERGDDRDVERSQRWENNVTRAFLITLSQLAPGSQVEFVQRLTGSRPSIPLQFGLLSGVDNVVEVQAVPIKKVLLTISRSTSRPGVGKASFTPAVADHLNHILNHIKLESDKDHEFRSKLVLAYQRSRRERVPPSFRDIPVEELPAYYALCHSAQPDAWVVCDGFAMVVESKVGQNAQNSCQLLRHLTDSSFGLGIPVGEVTKGEACDRYDMITTTWEKIAWLFEQVDGGSIFVRQFKEFLTMSGEILDLSVVLEETAAPITRKLRERFPLFLDKLDQKVAALHIDGLRLARRPSGDSLWDHYDYERGRKAEMEPHYSVYLREKWSGIALTTNTKNRRQIGALLESDALKQHIRKIIERGKAVELDRYYVGLVEYRQIDWKQGMMKEETAERFNFRVALGKLVGKPLLVDLVLDLMKRAQQYAKQLDFGMEIHYPDPGKEKKGGPESLRFQNGALIRDPERLLDLFAQFIRDTQVLVGVLG